MIFLLDTAFILVSIALLPPALVLLVQLLSAVLLPHMPQPREINDHGAVLAGTCILMPAHNEAAGLEQTLQALAPQLHDTCRLLVIADNCTDNTADIARQWAAGRTNVQIVERQHATQRGKGYALDYGIQCLRANPPRTVVVMDADCAFDNEALVHLAHYCETTNRPVQALYLMENHGSVGVAGRLAEFAWTIKNHVRALGDLLLGLPCTLMGTGMAFPWSVLEQAHLGTGHIVEDMKLAIELGEKACPPVFLPSAIVRSTFPESQSGMDTQRTRWEHGHLGVILKELPSVLLRAVRTGNWPLLALTLNLSVPPLSLLVMLLFTQTVASGLWALWSGHHAAFDTIASTTICVCAGIGLAWVVFCRHIISLRQLASIPFLLLRKIPHYFRFLRKPETKWVRTPRNGD